jgi:hypothetical protein
MGLSPSTQVGSFIWYKLEIYINIIDLSKYQWWQSKIIWISMESNINFKQKFQDPEI